MAEGRLLAAGGGVLHTLPAPEASWAGYLSTSCTTCLSPGHRSCPRRPHEANMLGTVSGPRVKDKRRQKLGD